MSKIGYFLTFAVGAFVGSTATWLFTKRKYEQIVQKEIDSVKHVFSRHACDFKDYETIVKEFGYISESNTSNVAETQDMQSPYIIEPDQFGRIPDYETITLTYYSDGVLTDNDERIDNMIDVVGVDFLHHFGEYESDAVYVRNERKKCDYEILLDHKTYSEVLKSKPWLEVENE